MALAAVEDDFTGCEISRRAARERPKRSLGEVKESPAVGSMLVVSGMENQMRNPDHAVTFLGDPQSAEFGCPGPLPDEIKILLWLLDGSERRHELAQRWLAYAENREAANSYARTRAMNEKPLLAIMRSSVARRKHVDLTQAVTAFYDPNTPTRDAVVLWRKALRRANAETKKQLLSIFQQLKEKKPTA
jgi:hypothetical protein